MLRQLNLGARGQGFFENMYKVVPVNKLCWQVYAAAVLFNAHRPWVRRLLFDGQFTGSVLRPLTSARRNVEKKNVVHFFALGVSEAYPTLSPADVARVMAHPAALLRDGYLRAINLVVPCLREDLTEAILACVDPDDDPEEAVYALHRAMQTNNLFSQAVTALQQGKEPYSTNGIHPGTTGYRRIARIMAQSLHLPEPAVALDSKEAESLRHAIVKKNTLYFHRWRPRNDAFVYGERKNEQAIAQTEPAKFEPFVTTQETAIRKQLEALK